MQGWTSHSLKCCVIKDTGYIYCQGLLAEAHRIWSSRPFFQTPWLSVLLFSSFPSPAKTSCVQNAPGTDLNIEDGQEVRAGHSCRAMCGYGAVGRGVIHRQEGHWPGGSRGQLFLSGSDFLFKKCSSRLGLGPAGSPGALRWWQAHTALQWLHLYKYVIVCAYQCTHRQCCM